MRAVLIALTAVSMLAALAANAAAAEFHLELDGVLSSPIGTWGAVDAPESFGSLGPGFNVSGILQLGRRYSVGARTGLTRNEKTGPLFLADSSGDPVVYDFTQKLTTVPTHLLVRANLGALSQAAVYAQAGAGVMSFTGKGRIDTGTSEAVVLAARQVDFSYFVGAGASYPLHRLVSAHFGLEFQQAISRNGSFWNDGDNPTFVFTRIGLSYPR